MPEYVLEQWLVLDGARRRLTEVEALAYALCCFRLRGDRKLPSIAELAKCTRLERRQAGDVRRVVVQHLLTRDLRERPELWGGLTLAEFEGKKLWNAGELYVLLDADVIAATRSTSLALTLRVLQQWIVRDDNKGRDGWFELRCRNAAKKLACCSKTFARRLRVLAGDREAGYGKAPAKPLIHLRHVNGQPLSVRLRVASELRDEANREKATKRESAPAPAATATKKVLAGLKAATRTPEREQELITSALQDGLRCLRKDLLSPALRALYGEPEDAGPPADATLAS